MRPLVLAFVAVTFFVLTLAILSCAAFGDIVQVAACHPLLDFVRHVAQTVSGGR